MSSGLHGSDIQFLHPYYVASDLKDLDAAFEDGKQRAIATLEKQIARIKSLSRADYNKYHGIEEESK